MTLREELMSNDPSPNKPVDPQEEVVRRHKPTLMLFVVCYCLMFGIHYLFRRPLQPGETQLSLMVYSVISSVFAGTFITVWVRHMRKLTWRQSLAYSGTIVAAMFCADIARIFLLYR